MTTWVLVSVSKLSGSPRSTSADRVRSSAACTAPTIVAPTFPLAPNTPTRIGEAYCARLSGLGCPDGSVTRCRKPGPRAAALAFLGELKVTPQLLGPARQHILKPTESALIAYCDL